MENTTKVFAQLRQAREEFSNKAKELLHSLLEEEQTPSLSGNHPRIKVGTNNLQSLN